MTRRYEDFAEKNLNVVLRNGSEWMVRCCFHENEGSPSMQFNVEKGMFVCFSCGAGGGMKTLSKHLGIRHQDPAVDVNDLIGKLNRLKKQAKEDDAILTVLPEDHLHRYNFPTDYWGECPKSCRYRRRHGVRQCRNHRGFTEDTISAFDLGYDPLDNAAIIPLRNINGGLIGIIRRYLDEDVEFRYKYPMGFKRSTALFGSWLVEQDTDDVAVLVEGSVDAMAVWQAGYMGLAQYGSSISRQQVRTMIRLGIRHVVLMQDNDKAGNKARRQALGYRQHLRDGKMIEEYDPTVDLSRHFSISRVHWERKHSDPGALATKPTQIRNLVDNSVNLI